MSDLHIRGANGERSVGVSVIEEILYPQQRWDYYQAQHEHSQRNASITLITQKGSISDNTSSMPRGVTVTASANVSTWRGPWTDLILVQGMVLISDYGNLK